jgi:mRNA-degrading endonuclease RelE of RelBE toxin-antitoxin system
MDTISVQFFTDQSPLRPVSLRVSLQSKLLTGGYRTAYEVVDEDIVVLVISIGKR